MVHKQTRISIFNNTSYSLTSIIKYRYACARYQDYQLFVLVNNGSNCPVETNLINHSADYNASTVRYHFKILTTTMLLSLPEL